MTYVHDLSSTPPPRYDGLPWTGARIQQSADNVTFVDIDTKTVTPVDADPKRPAIRRFTTSLATIPEGYFRLIWTDAMSNESPPSQSVFSPSTADDGYPALDALLAASSVTELTDDLDTDQQAALRRNAIEAIEDYCHQSFVAEGTVDQPVTKLLDADGGDTLWLPARLAPGFTLNTTGSWITGSDVDLSAEGDRLAVAKARWSGGSWLTRALADIQLEEGPARFVEGRDAVEITGVWGWSADEWAAGTLDRVEEAIRMDMEDQALANAHKLASTVRSARALGVSGIGQGGLSLTMRAGEPGLSVRVQRKLVKFRWQAPAAARV